MESMTTIVQRWTENVKSCNISYTPFGWVALLALPFLSWTIIMQGFYVSGMSSTLSFYWGVFAGLMTLLVWLGLGFYPES